MYTYENKKVRFRVEDDVVVLERRNTLANRLDGSVGTVSVMTRDICFLRVTLNPSGGCLAFPDMRDFKSYKNLIAFPKKDAPYFEGIYRYLYEKVRDNRYFYHFIIFGSNANAYVTRDEIRFENALRVLGFSVGDSSPITVPLRDIAAVSVGLQKDEGLVTFAMSGGSARDIKIRFRKEDMPYVGEAKTYIESRIESRQKTETETEGCE